VEDVRPEIKAQRETCLPEQAQRPIARPVRNRTWEPKYPSAAHRACIHTTTPGKRFSAPLTGLVRIKASASTHPGTNNETAGRT
jgi:hypothetical protein